MGIRRRASTHIGRSIAQKESVKAFAHGLLKWNKTQNFRKMPWKGEKDPYKIWLSEIILQQTRVEQGLGYYERLIKAYPTIKDLAKAPEQEVFKLWEGLGYYSRCKNLIATAKYIAGPLNGQFPREYDSILSLKGIGSYTAAAIASFAFNQPYAVLDGNVFRILSRIFNVNVPIDTKEGKELFSSLAQKVLSDYHPGEYNQAIMDFGATICKPVPECNHCFFSHQCVAYLQNSHLELPVKSKKIEVRERWFNYIIVKQGNRYAIRQRVLKDIWSNLFEFLLIEANKKYAHNKVLSEFETKFGVTKSQYRINDDTLHCKQRLSHQLIHFQFIPLELYKPVSFPKEIIWVDGSELSNYPFPKTLQQYIKCRF